MKYQKMVKDFKVGKYTHCPSEAGPMPRAPYIPLAMAEVVMIMGAPVSSTATGNGVPCTPIGITTGFAVPST